LEAYAIFDGGGMLGAALAGGLKAAEDRGIKFTGFGGTSAGSIIALLASVGYSGEEIGKIIVDTDFAELLVGKGNAIDALLEDFDYIVAGLESGWWHKAFAALGRAKKMVGNLKDFGVDDGSALKRWLREKIEQRGIVPRKDEPITFEFLASRGCYPLKVVASDVTRRRPAIYSLADAAYGNSVVEAIRASTCYPFVFKPPEIENRRLVDGGLSSNLPAFLFHEEQQNGTPVFAFDLTYDDDEEKAEEKKALETSSSGGAASSSLKSFMKNLASTALDSGDELMRSVLKGVEYIPIKVPKRFDVLDFHMSREKREELFNLGYTRAGKKLNEVTALKIMQSAANHDVRTIIQARYSEMAVFEAALAALAREIGAISDAEKLRAHVILPTPQRSRIIVFSYGMYQGPPTDPHWDSDYTIEHPKEGGYGGLVLKRGVPELVDVNDMLRDLTRWGLHLSYYGQIANSGRKSMLSVAIRPLADVTEKSMARMRGTLSVDSSTPLVDTRWKEASGGVREEILKPMQIWGDILYSLLQ
jgi:NTE family protein